MPTRCLLIHSISSTPTSSIPTPGPSRTLNFSSPLVSGPPILPHTLLLLTSSPLAAFAVYLLVVFLTGDRRAGLVSGVIFAFAAFRLSRLGQLQIQLGS